MGGYILRRHSKVTTVSTDMLLLILIISSIRVSEQMKQIPETHSVHVCKGNDVDLVWKVDEDENRISKLEWYFNNKTICTSSSADAFTVNTPYHGRIERTSKTGIELKNVSLEDEGMFILFPLIAWSTRQNMQTISLQVLEPPANNCTCMIKYTGSPSKIICELVTSLCGRPQLFAVWKRKETFEVLGEGNYIMVNSSFQDNEIICCLEGPAMTCVDDPRRFCITVSIPNRDDEKQSEGGSITQPTDLVTMPVPQQRDNGFNNINCIQSYVVVVISAVCLMALILVCVMLTQSKRQNNKERVNEWKSLKEIVTRKEINSITAKQGDANHESEEDIVENQNNTDSKIMTYRKRVRLPFTQCLGHETEEAIAEYHPCTVSEPMLEIQELGNTAFCKICFATKMSMAFMPCSHVATCARCSIDLQKCPICRSIIDRKMSLSFA